MIQAAVQAEIGKLSDFMGPHFSTPGVIPTPEAPAEPVPELSHNGNAVIQEKPLGAQGDRVVCASLSSTFYASIQKD